MKLVKLKKLELVFDQGQEHMLPTVIDTFPTLTHFAVIFIDTNDENAIYESLKSISNLKNLIHFKLHFEFENNNNGFCDLLKHLANNCPNLKSIDTRFIIDQDLRNPDIRQLFSELKSFPALKRLNLELLFANNKGDDKTDYNKMFSFELFKDFSIKSFKSLFYFIWWDSNSKNFDTQRY